MADIHDNIYTFRKARKMSMEALGKLIGVSKQTIQRYESREIKNIPYDKIISLSKVFNIEPAELMGWSDDSTELPDGSSAIKLSLDDLFANKEISMDHVNNNGRIVVNEADYNRFKTITEYMDKFKNIPKSDQQILFDLITAYMESK